MTWDPLEGIDPPAGDPGALEIMSARMTGWSSSCDECGQRQRSAFDTVTEAGWRSVGSLAARSGAERVVAAYRRAADDLGGAVQAVRRCASEWSEAQARYVQARRMADEAMVAAVAAAGAVPSTGTGLTPDPAGSRWGPGMTESADPGPGLAAAELAARARALALSAVEDFDAASTRAATALGRLAGQIDSTPAFVARHSGRSWYEGPVSWAFDTLKVGERAARGTAHIGQYVASNPDVFGKLAADAVQVGGGAALMTVSSGGFGMGVALDLTGAGLPVGIPLDAVSTAGMVAGAGLLLHGSMDGMGDLTGGGGSGGGGDGGDGGDGGGGDGGLPKEGDVNYPVRRDGGSTTITDIDRIDDGVLWEIKSATSSGGDDAAWVDKHINQKFLRYLEARTLMPGYEDAPIGWDFVKPGALPEFRASVEAAVAQLRTLNPDVTIYLRWAS